jgi:NAD(P)-dependent dehydrogenase (short-subunit alcohol dehydrogenase family)
MQELDGIAPLPGAQAGTVEVMTVDLSSFASVRRFCQDFIDRDLPVHYILCNAGLMAPLKRLQTDDGLEMQLQVPFACSCASTWWPCQCKAG